MVRSKAKKRTARRKHQAKRLAALAPRQIGRRRARDPSGPTPETAAKLKPDTLASLRALRVDGEPFLDTTLAEAGEEVLRAWMLITSAVDCRSPSPGAGPDRASAARLQAVWRRWCGGNPSELWRRCTVRPAQVVDWIKDSAACGTDPRGTAGALKRSLQWWTLAARDTGGATT